MYAHTVGAVSYRFQDLRTLLAKATPLRSLSAFLTEAVVTGTARHSARSCGQRGKAAG